MADCEHGDLDMQTACRKHCDTASGWKEKVREWSRGTYELTSVYRDLSCG